MYRLVGLLHREQGLLAVLLVGWANLDVFCQQPERGAPPVAAAGAVLAAVQATEAHRSLLVTELAPGPCAADATLRQLADSAASPYLTLLHARRTRLAAALQQTSQVLNQLRSRTNQPAVLKLANHAGLPSPSDFLR